MIKTFRCKHTAALFSGWDVKRFGKPLQVSALSKLKILDAAAGLEDLRVPPGNRMEALKGKRSGQYSIRINQQFRICFRFVDGHFWDVEIVDYH